MAIPDVLKTIEDLRSIGIHIIEIIEKKDYAEAFGMIQKMIALFSDVKLAIPEIKTMHGDDVKQLLEAIISAIEAVIAEVKSRGLYA